MKIGITERGDAALDFSWYDKVKNGKVDGAVLITKNLSEAFIQKVLDLHEMGYKLIVHVTCTGWGGTVIEPNVPTYKNQLAKLSVMISAGFPAEQCVLRIDPIIPTPNGLKRVEEVINKAYEIGLLPKVRVRISVLDEYKHVKERLHKLGYPSFYPEGCWQASDAQMENLLKTLHKFSVNFYACAETRLDDGTDKVIQSGCISGLDLAILGFPFEEMGLNPQNRKGCMCLSCKTELLENKCQCGHKCLYCYWRN